MEKRWLWIPVLALSAISGLGCGDDSGGKDKTDAAMPAPDAGKDSGTPATPDAGGTGGMVAVAEPVPCGAMSCAQPVSLIPAGMGMGMAAAVPGIALPMAMACCFDAAASECGITMALPDCMKLAVADPTCPSLDLGPLGALLMGAVIGAGCCTADGQCGIDAAALGNGCTENSEAAAMLAASPLGPFAAVFPFPPSQPCGGGADGGTDAGN